MVALGSGKGSSLFRVVRDGMNLSYRQDALLWPSAFGWKPFLVIGMEPQPDEASYRAKAEEVRQALLKDVESWTEANRQRAVGYAGALVTRGGDASPLFFRYGGPLATDVTGRTRMAAYWMSKTGSAWNPEALASSFASIPLEELKAEATAMLSGASVSISAEGRL
jgi:hypothetical protein